MRRSRINIPTALLVMYVLVFNAITSTVVLGGDSNSALLCTSSGYQLVALAGSDESSKNVLEHCKVCLFAQNDDNFDSDFLIWNSPPQILVDQALARLKDNQQKGLSTRFKHLIAQGRAPPLVFSFDI